MTVPNFIAAGLTAVLSDIPDPVSVISPDYRILWSNNVVLEYLKANLDEVRGRLCFEALLGKQRQCPVCPVRLVFDSGQSSVVEKSFAGPDGSVIWREVRAYPIRDEAGVVVAAIRIGFDITEKKRRRHARARRLEALESALRDLSRADKAEPIDHSEAEGARALTAKELGVLRLLANGLTNKEIAGILCISHHTVKSHVAHLFDKLGVTHRAEAAAKAARLKLI